MGNASSNLPFDIGASIDYTGNAHWQLHNGYKKGDSENKEEVSIFRFTKASQSDKLAVAQRAVQKLRTLKHPSVLGFVDSTEMEDQLVLVTEPCIPLEAWLTEQCSISKSAEDRLLIFEEALWGLKCIITALAFLHTAGNMTHGYLGPHAIFICKSGDWKLGCMDLAANGAVAADAAMLASYSHLLSAPYQAPERRPISDAAHRAPQGSADIYSLAQIITKVATDLQCKIPASTQKLLTRMSTSDPAKRPSADSLLSQPVFNSEHAQLLNSLGDLTIKPTSEVIAVLNSLVPKANMLPRPVCVHKIIPALSRVLQMAVNDFGNRDSREASRQAVDQAMCLIAELAKQQKLEESAFAAKCVPVLAVLWPMPDRAIRTTLLKTSKYVMPLIPDAAFNKGMFDAMLAGFADSNAKMREETLKNLVHVVDKLDEKHLQDKLVRCISSLQGDAEASIRTNVTIFLGKIAPKLKESTRARILCASFQKAMRDNFMHCRIAGLRATLACLSLLEPAQLSKTIMPQLCILLMDRHHEVRDLTISLLESCMPIMRQELIRLADQERQHKEAHGAGDHGPTGSGSGTSGAGDNNAAGMTGSFLSWAVDGLAKGLEKAAIASAGAPGTAGVPADGDASPAASRYSAPISGNVQGMKLNSAASVSTSSSNIGASSNRTSGSSTVAAPKSSSSALAAKVPTQNDDFDDWDVDGDLDLGDDDNTDTNALNSSGLDMLNSNELTGSSSSTSLIQGATSSGGGGWGDDDFDLDDDDDQYSRPPAQKANGSSLSSAGSSSKSSSGVMSIANSKPPVTASKSVVQKSAWDDDDDLFSSVDLKVVEPKAPKSKASTSSNSLSADDGPNPRPSTSSSNNSLSLPRPSASASPVVTPVTSSPGPSVTSSKSVSKPSSTTTSTTSSSAAKKPAVTKLAVDKSDWDDF